MRQNAAHLREHTDAHIQHVPAGRCLLVCRDIQSVTFPGGASTIKLIDGRPVTFIPEVVIWAAARQSLAELMIAYVPLRPTLVD
jgi:hypothetical protein